jgi:hypothetical protein
MPASFLSLNRCLFVGLVASAGCVGGALEQSGPATEETVASPDTTAGVPAAQTFTAMSNVPISPSFAQVLTDGRVLVQNYSSGTWYTLTPDLTGSYLNGTWKPAATMPAGYEPLFFASAVLPDGRFFAGGGEYNFADATPNDWTNLAAIYDPIADSWKSVAAPAGWTMIGDAQSLVLADGRYMMANCCSTQDAVLNPTNLTWTAIGTGKEDSSNDEEGWTLLPDGRVLTVDSENATKLMESETFSPTTGAWTSAGSTLVQLADNSTPNSSFELGPAMLRPDGTVLATGAIGHNSVFNSNTNTWTAATDFPKNTANAQLDCADAPAALLPNGNVLVATSPGTFNAGTVFFEWDGTKFNKITAAPTSATADSSFLYNMVVLPTGEVFVTSSSNDVEIYEPAAAGDTTAIQPVITAVPVLESGFGFTDAELQAIRSAEAQPLDGKVTPDLLPLMNIYTGRTYTVAGTRLNGISQAASYGDDAQASTAFPLVRFTNQATGHVQYARTHDGSNYSIAKTATGSTHVDIPATIEGGLSNMQVVANGIASPALLVNVK